MTASVSRVIAGMQSEECSEFLTGLSIILYISLIPEDAVDRRNLKF